MSNPLALFRRYQKSLLAVFGVAIIFVFVVGSYLQKALEPSGGGGGGAEETVVRWKYGSVNEREIDDMQRSHMMAVRFVEAIVQETQKRNGTPKAQPIAMAQSEEDVFATYMLAKKAEQLGLVVSEAAVRDWLFRLSDEVIGASEFGKIMNDALGDRIGQQQLFDHLKVELLAQNMRMLAFSGVTAITPSSAWDYHRRLNRRVSTEMLPIEAADYVDSIKDKPSDKEIEALYNKHKNDFPFPNSPDPGFRQRQQIAFQYFKIEFEKFLQEEMKNVTEEVIKEEYEKRLSQGMYKVSTPPPVPGAGLPGITEDGFEAPPAPGADAATPGEDSPKKPTGDEPSPEKTTPEKTTPEKSAPEKTTPEKTTPEKTTPEKTTPEKTTPEKTTPEKTTPEKTTPEKTAPEKTAPEKAGVPPGDGQANRQLSNAIFVSAQEKSPETKTEEPIAEQPIAEQPKTEQPKTEQPKTEQPKTEQPKTEQPKTEQPKTEQPKTEQPKTEQPKTEQPKTEQPKTEQPKTEQPKTEQPKTEQPKTEQPKTEQPKTEQPKTEQPKTEQPKTEEATPEKVKPLAEVRDEIARSLARPEAQTRMDAAIKEARRQIDRFAQKYGKWVALKEVKEDAVEPEQPDFSAVAEEYGFTLGQTRLMDPLEIADTEIGGSFRFSFAGGQIQTMPFGQIAYQSGVPLYKTDRIEGSVRDVTFVFWRTEEVEERVPELEEIKAEVIVAWRMKKALELAKKEATSIAKKIADGGKSLRDVVTEKQAEKVIEPLPFTWMSMGNVAMSRMGTPQISQVDRVEYAGHDFMESVFSLDVSEVGVAVNQPETVAYVVRLLGQSPSPEMQREQFIETGLQFQEFQLSQMERQTYFRDWYDELKDEMKVVWQRDARVYR